MQLTAGNNNNINNKHNHQMFIDSLSFCNSFFKDLLVKTFDGVGLQNAKKMAPKTVSLQSAHILASFTTQAFTQKLPPPIKLLQDKDFKPPSIDNLAVQQIDSQKAEPVGALPQIIQETLTNKSRIKSKKTVTQSIRSRKFTQISQQIPQIKLKQISQFEKLPQISNQFDRNNDSELNRVRANYFNIEKENLERQRELNAQRQKNLVERQKNQKIMKDMKRITYDYQGKLFGQGTGLSQPEKLVALKNKFGKTTLNPMTQIKPPIQSTSVQTNRKRDNKSDKKDYKQAPMFRDKAQGIIETIEVNKGISAGVKIIEQMSDKKSVTRQNPLKKPTIHSLADFKNTMKESRFREYHALSLTKQKSSSMNISSIQNQQTTRSNNNKNNKNLYNNNNNINPNNNPNPINYNNKPNSKPIASRRNSLKREIKSKSSYSLMDGNKKSWQYLQGSESSRIIDGSSIVVQEQSNSKIDNNNGHKVIKYRGLPFIRSKGFRAVDIGSQNGFSIVSQSVGRQDNKQYVVNKIRSKIIIKDINLLKLTLQDLE